MRSILVLILISLSSLSFAANPSDVNVLKNIDSQQIESNINNILQNQRKLDQKIDDFLNNSNGPNLDTIEENNVLDKINTNNPSRINLDNISIDSTPIPTLPNLSTIKEEHLKKARKYLFVSWSMPKPMLQEYYKLSKEYGYILVMRGFKNDSPEEYIKFAQEKDLIGYVIYPKLFRKFNVTYAVPCFVEVYGDNKFHKICGALTYKYVEEEFMKVGYYE